MVFPRALVVTALVLSACGADDTAGPTAPASDPEPATAEPASAEPAGAEPAPSAESASRGAASAAEVDAIRRAEAFVRAQGYTEAAPTVSGDEVVREGIEGTLADRRGLLEPDAVSAGQGQDGGWSVVFRYRDPRYAGRGRLLRLPEGAPPSFVHQDLVLSPEE